MRPDGLWVNIALGANDGVNTHRYIANLLGKIIWYKSQISVSFR